MTCPDATTCRTAHHPGHVPGRPEKHRPPVGGAGKGEAREDFENCGRAGRRRRRACAHRERGPRREREDRGLRRVVLRHGDDDRERHGRDHQRHRHRQGHGARRREDHRQRHGGHLATAVRPVHGPRGDDRHREEQAHLQGRRGLDRVRRRSRAGVQHLRQSARREGHRSACEGEGHPEVHGRLRPGRGHLHRQVQGEVDPVTAESESPARRRSMRRRTAVLVGMFVLTLTAVGLAAVPGEIPFPSQTVESVFVSTRTVTAPSSPDGPGVLTNFYARGSTVVFQVFAGATKTGKILTGADVKYAYVKLPDGTKIKLSYKEPANTTDPAWSGTWTIPANYTPKVVDFVVRFRTKDKQYGNFVQIPVSTSQLTVTAG